MTALSRARGGAFAGGPSVSGCPSTPIGGSIRPCFSDGSGNRVLREAPAYAPDAPSGVDCPRTDVEPELDRPSMRPAGSFPVGAATEDGHRLGS